MSRLSDSVLIRLRGLTPLWLVAGSGLMLAPLVIEWALGPGQPLWARPVGPLFLVGSLINLAGALVVREAQRRAGARTLVAVWEASRAWTAATFAVGPNDYDPDGPAWSELVTIARSKGYDLGTDGVTFARAD